MRAFPIRQMLVTLAFLATFQLGPVFAQVMPDPTPDLQLQFVSSSGTETGEVYVMLRQPDGRMLVGGRFNRASNGAVTRSALLRLERDGTIDTSFAPILGGSSTVEVNALAVSGGAIYVGGFFETVNGATMRSIVRLRLDGSIEPGFSSPMPSAAANQIAAIAVTPTGLYLGGDTQEGDSWGLIRLDPASGAIDGSWVAQTQFNPTASPINGNRGEITTMVVSGSDLIVGGSFGQIAGVVQQGIARISQASPVAVRAFNAGISGRIDALAPAGSQIYVGGNFFHSNPAVNYVGRIDATSGAFDAGWAPPISGAVSALLRIGDQVYVGGSFTNQPVGGRRVARVAAATGAIDGSFAPAINNTVYALADTCRGKLEVGGTFVTAGGIARNGFAAFSVPQIDCIFYGDFEIH